MDQHFDYARATQIKCSNFSLINILKMDNYLFIHVCVDMKVALSFNFNATNCTIICDVRTNTNRWSVLYTLVQQKQENDRYSRQIIIMETATISADHVLVP